MSEPALSCEHCGGELGPADAYCPQCGHMSPVEVPPAPESDVYLMLMTANVLRLRRQWDLAEARCSEVLSRDPGNTGAYSVLGDISRDRGNSRDAIEWYKLALDRNPANAADRAKLESMIDAVFSDAPRTTAEKAGSAVRRRFSDAVATVRNWQRPCALAVLLAAVLSVLLVIAAYTIVLDRGAASQRAGAPRGAFVAAPAPQSRPDAGQGRGLGLRLIPPPQEITGDISALELALSQELAARAQRLDPSCEVLGAEIEPVSATAAIRCSLPRLWSRASTRDSVLRVVREIADATRAWDPRLSRLRIRFYLNQPGIGQELGMTAEGSPEQLAKLGEEPTTAAGAPGAVVWWHSELRQ